MIPQTLKGAPPPEGYLLFESNKSKLDKHFQKNKILSFSVYILFITIVGVCMFGLSTWIYVEFKSLHAEIEELRNEVYTLKSDSGIVAQIRRFENEDNQYNDDYDFTTPATWDQETDTLYDNDYQYNDVFDDDENDDIDIDEETGLKTGGKYTKEGKETIVTAVRSRRDIVAATPDGVPVNAESYAEVRKNRTQFSHNKDGLKLYGTLTNSKEATSSQVPQHQSRYQSPAWLARSLESSNSERLRHYKGMETSGIVSPTPTPMLTRQSRVMHTNEDKSKAFRRVVKKSMLKSNSRVEDVKPNYQEHMSGSEVTIVRDDGSPIRRKHHNRHRAASNLETLDERPTPSRAGVRKVMPAIHFSGDTSKYVLGQHTNYKGNGHLGHPDKTFIDWEPSTWARGLGMDKYYQMKNGVLTIKETGLYFIYAQIYYLDEHDLNGYRVHKNDQTLLQCTTMTHSQHRVLKGNTCYSGAADYLTEGDHLSISDLSTSRYSLFEPGKSFFGVVKLSDARIK